MYTPNTNPKLDLLMIALEETLSEYNYFLDSESAYSETKKVVLDILLVEYNKQAEKNVDYKAVKIENDKIGFFLMPINL